MVKFEKNQARNEFGDEGRASEIRSPRRWWLWVLVWLALLIGVTVTQRNASRPSEGVLDGTAGGTTAPQGATLEAFVGTTPMPPRR